MQVVINISLINDVIVIASLDNANLAIACSMSSKTQKVLKRL